MSFIWEDRSTVINMSLLKLWFIRNPVLVSYSICMRQGSSDPSGSQSALACLCVCARAQLGLREFNIHMPIACAHTTGNINTDLSQVSY
jgi:hypothetical protein